MFDPDGPLDQDLCDEILIEVSRRRRAEETKHSARIKCIAEDLGYERAEVKNNAEYLIAGGYLHGALGGFLGLTRKGAAVVKKLLDES